MYQQRKVLNLSQPINLSNPLNRGLVSRWQVINQGPYSGGARILDLAGRNHSTLASTQTRDDNSRTGGYGAIKSPTGIYSTTPFGNKDTRCSYAAWIKWNLPGATDYPFATLGVIENGNPAIHDRNFEFSASVISFRVYDGSDKKASYTSGTNSDIWWHLIGTVDGTNIRLYVNGVLQGTTLCGDPYTGYSDPRFRLGNSSVGAAVLFDDYRIANRVWTDSECSDLYRDSRSGSPLTLNWLQRPMAFDGGAAGGATTRGRPFGQRGNAFNGGRTFQGIINP